MSSDEKILTSAKNLLAKLEKQYKKLSQRIECTADLDKVENVGYALQQMKEVIEALECNV